MRRRASQAEVELTPLIDVLFILIIFFVLTASFVQGQIPLDLPDGRGVPPQEQGMTISMTEDGSIYLNDSPVDREALIEGARRALDQGKSLILVADRSIPYGEVASLLDLLRLNGVSSVGLGLKGTEP